MNNESVASFFGVMQMHYDKNGVSPSDPGRMNSERGDLGRWRFVMEGDSKGFETAVHPEFFEDVLDMIAHGGGADVEGLGNARGPFA